MSRAISPLKSNRWLLRHRLRIGALALLLAAFASRPAPAEPNWHVFPLKSSRPAVGIVGLDGSLWFTTGLCCAPAPSFGRISYTGAIKFFSTAGLFPGAITSGGGALWMSSLNLVAKLLAYTPRTHQLTVHSGRGPSGDQVGAGQLAWAPTGDLWFVEQSHIGRLMASGKIVEYATHGQPTGALVLGPDSGMWFTLPAGIVSRIDPVTFGVVSVQLPSDDCTLDRTSVYSLAAGPDGDLYGACFSNPQLPASYFYRIDPATLSVARYGPYVVRVYGIAVAPDGIIYIANGYPNALAAFDYRSRAIRFYYTPNGDGVGALTLGPDDNVWAVMGQQPAIGTLLPRRH